MNITTFLLQKVKLSCSIQRTMQFMNKATFHSLKKLIMIFGEHKNNVKLLLHVYKICQQ